MLNRLKNGRTVSDNFANNKHYLNNFIDYFKEKNTRYEWGCAIRPDNVTHDQLARMQDAGCFLVFCGTDSGSAKILKDMVKMPSSKRSYQFFEDCFDLGLHFETNTIIGYPDERDTDLEDSLSIIFDAVAHGSTSADASILQPLPGAPVTLENQPYLVFVEDPQFGTFLPNEVMELVRSDLGSFPGFSFISKGNKAFSYYISVVNLVRYFTRHFFRTVFFLKQCCGVQYIDLFNSMASETDPKKYAEHLRQFIFNEVSVDPYLSLAKAIYAYDESINELNSVDVAKEIENVYSDPEQVFNNITYKLLDLEFEVHQLFENLPRLSVSQEISKPTSYLFSQTKDHNTITLRLSMWQRDMWVRLERDSSSLNRDDLVEEYIERLMPRVTTDRSRAHNAVCQALELFGEILQIPSDFVEDQS